jgi:hypothetical protein
LRLTIPVKLGAAFAGILVLTTVLGLFAVSRTATMRDDTTSLGADVVPATRVASAESRARAADGLQQLVSGFRLTA